MTTKIIYSYVFGFHYVNGTQWAFRTGWRCLVCSREVVGSPPWTSPKAIWTQAWAPCSVCPCLHSGWIEWTQRSLSAAALPGSCDPHPTQWGALPRAELHRWVRPFTPHSIEGKSHDGRRYRANPTAPSFFFQEIWVWVPRFLPARLQLSLPSIPIKISTGNRGTVQSLFLR